VVLDDAKVVLLKLSAKLFGDFCTKYTFFLYEMLGGSKYMSYICHEITNSLLNNNKSYGL